jgi:predicted ATPase
VSCVSLLVLVARPGSGKTSLEAEVGSAHGYATMPRVVGRVIRVVSCGIRGRVGGI